MGRAHRIIAKNESNETLIYDFSKDEVSSPYKAAYIKNRIKTRTEGLSEIFNNNNIFVEDQNNGRLLVMTIDGKINWEYINSAKDGNTYLLNWSSYLHKKKYEKTIEYLKSLKCNG